jgi:predicted phage terminase large subunit-like protein
MNTDTGEFELKPIVGWFENPGSEIVEISLSDGSSIRCTPNHMIWTYDGWVKAENLTRSHRLPSPPVFDCPNKPRANTVLQSKFSLSVRRGAYFQSLFWRDLAPDTSVARKSETLSYITPVDATSNLINGASFDPISRGNISALVRALGDFYSLRFSKNRARAPFMQGKCSVSFRVGNVLGARSIFEIFKARIGWISVLVANFLSFWTGAYESCCYQLVGKNVFATSSNSYRVPRISLAENGRHDLSWDNKSSSFFTDPIDYSHIATEAAECGDVVKSISATDGRSPLFIQDASHAETTFCLEVADNHTFLCGRGNLIVVSNCDDPHNVIDIESDIVRSETIRWFRESLSNRLNSPESSAIIIIMQRLHELDVSGVLLENDFDYVHLCIPMLYEFNELTIDGKPIENSIGWTDPRYDPDPEMCEGFAAWPERFPVSALAQLQKEIGSHAWAGQYMQTPSPRGGDVIRGDWWQVWDPPNGQFPEFDFILAAADTAFTEKKQNDPSAITVWGCFKEGDERRIMLVDAWQKRKQLHGSLPLQEAYEYNSNAKSKWNGPPNPEYLKRCETKLPRKGKETEKDARADRLYYSRIQEEWGLVEWLIHTCRVRRVDRLIIEGKASGLDAAHELERIAGREGWGIDLVDAKGDKLARALAVQPIFSQGLVYAPNRPFADMVIKQCEVFPRGRHDDLVDATTHALKWLRSNGFADRPQEIRDRKDEEARFKPKVKALYSGLD